MKGSNEFPDEITAEDGYDLHRAVVEDETPLPYLLESGVEIERRRGANDDRIAIEMLAFIRDQMNGEVSEWVGEQFFSHKTER